MKFQKCLDSNLKLEMLPQRMTVFVEVGLASTLSCYCEFWVFIVSHFFTTQSAVSYSSLKTFSTSVHSVMMTELFFCFFLKSIIGGVKTKTHDSSQVNFPTFVHIVI